MAHQPRFGDSRGRVQSRRLSLSFRPLVRAFCVIVLAHRRSLRSTDLQTLPPEAPDSLGAAEESPLDCLRCGACCRTGADGRILLPPEDLVRWRRIGRPDLALRIQPGHFGLDAFATTADGTCTHLGTSTEVNGCQIYQDRGTTCREFTRGGPQCLEFRRDFGVGMTRADQSLRSTELAFGRSE